MDFAVVTGAPIVIQIGDRQDILTKPTRGKLGELYARWVAQDRAALKIDLEEAGAAPEERKARLLKFAADCRLASYPLGCLAEWDRAQQTLELAGAPADAIEALDIGEAQTIAMRLWGYMPPAGGAEDESPKAPARASPPTGS